MGLRQRPEHIGRLWMRPQLTGHSQSLIAVVPYILEMQRNAAASSVTRMTLVIIWSVHCDLCYYVVVEMVVHDNVCMSVMQCVQCLSPFIFSKQKYSKKPSNVCQSLPLSMLSPAKPLQVDDALTDLSTACNCSLRDLINHHSTALLKLLQPLPESLHAASDLVAYSHLFLPWAAVSQAAQAAATMVVTQPRLPQLPQSFYAQVHDQYVKCLQHTMDLNRAPGDFGGFQSMCMSLHSLGGRQSHSSTRGTSK